MNKYILICLFLLSHALQYAQTKPLITPEDVWLNYRFYCNNTQYMQFLADGKHYTKLSDNKKAIEKFNLKKDKYHSTLLDLSNFDQLKHSRIAYYKINTPETHILFCIYKIPIYRYSFKAEFLIYSISSGKISYLTNEGPVQVPHFSPSGEKIGFVYNNNLYYKDLKTSEEIQLTIDGKINSLIHGLPDWVYEEEFGFNRAYEWSPDEEHIAWMTFNEADIPEYTWFTYDYSNNSQSKKVYPGSNTIKYPKSGEPISKVSVSIHNIKTKNTILLQYDSSQYVPRIKFSNSGNICFIFTLNRLQNHLKVFRANSSTGDTTLFYEEKTKAYIDERIFDNFICLEDNKHVIIQSEKDGYFHLYLYDIEGNFIRQLTKGYFDAMQFVGFSRATQQIIYQSTEASPMQRHIYTTDLKGEGKQKITQGNGWHEGQFIPGSTYFIHSYSNHTSPPVHSLANIDGQTIRIIEGNQVVAEDIAQLNFCKKEFMQIFLNDTLSLNSWMIKPNNFSVDSVYPLVLIQYSGPCSQEVKDEWQLDFEQVLAQKGYIVACVDPRGTDARGADFRKQTYLQLGKYETEDLTKVADYFGRFRFVDKDKIGIYGWSYGGYTSLLCMTKGAGHFKAGISIAPVTNWRFYDNIYTERYMRAPVDNPGGYDENSPLYFAHMLKDPLLLIHGTADDNVHIQNTYEMAKQLVLANKQFDMQVYSNKNHSIYGKNARYHLYMKCIGFFEQHLK